MYGIGFSINGFVEDQARFAEVRVAIAAEDTERIVKIILITTRTRSLTAVSMFNNDVMQHKYNLGQSWLIKLKTLVTRRC